MIYRYITINNGAKLLNKLTKIFFILACFLSVNTAIAQSSDDYCREFTQTFTISGKTETGYGTACLQEDGSWKIISQEDNNEDNQDNNISYVVKEKDVYIVPRTVIITPGHKWYPKPHGPRHHIHGW